MQERLQRAEPLPNAPGVGFKSQHFDGLLSDPGPVSWIEVHAENYMGDGGRPLVQLRELCQTFALSVHGVGLNIGGAAPLDKTHLAKLKHLIDWSKPASFSEHLAWSSHEGAYLNDLLPLPYTQDTLTRVADHIDQVQDTIGRQMLLENPSSYLTFQDSTLSEIEFIHEVVHKTKCKLLLDINNVFISAANLDFTPKAYLDAFPLDHVGEIHVGGHATDRDGSAKSLLIDTHGTPVADPVWALLETTLAKCGPRPVLVEWDTDVPTWPILRAQAQRAAQTLSR
ncbi:MAG: DUF692 domain-containing protein [Sulfitobacter sp.]